MVKSKPNDITVFMKLKEMGRDGSIIDPPSNRMKTKDSPDVQRLEAFGLLK